MAKSRSERAGARRTVLKSLASIKSRINVLQGWWNVSGTKYGDEFGPRPRYSEEYPEAQRRYWASTIREIDAMINDLTVLREQCIAEYDKTPEN